MDDWREFRFLRKGKEDLIWMIKQSGESYTTRHGQVDGKLQEFTDTPGPKGKEGTKAYVNAIDNCHFHLTRECRKKQEAGYVEYLNNLPIKEQITEVTFNKFLPKNFVSYKPQTDISISTLEKIYEAGNARFTRKLDGFCHLAVHHDWGWEIYSRRMDLISGHFPNHIVALNNPNLGTGTLLVGEMVCLRLDGTDDFKSTSRICRSLEEEARKLVESGAVSEPRFVIFDCLFYNGKDLKDTPYDDRAKIWKNNFRPLAESKDNLICSIDYFQLSPDTWETYAKERHWEGFVVTDGSSKPGSKFYSFNGKAERPKGHHKLKTTRTEDCVVFAYEEGTGKRLGKVGSLWIKQINPETGKYQSYGKVGSGFTEEDIEVFTQKCLDLDVPRIKKESEIKNIDKNYGLVIEIKFSERQEDTGKFRFPVYLRTRTDKKEEECVANI